MPRQTTRKLLIVAALLIAGGSAAAAPRQQPVKGPLTIANPVRVSKASIELVCGDKTYRLSTGNKKGDCAVSEGVAECNDSKGNSSHAECGDGCMTTGGAGSCEAKN